MGLVNRCCWLYESFVLRRKIKGFYASFFSSCDKRVKFAEYVRLYGKTTLINVSIGRYTYIAGASAGNAIIGSFCSIGPDVKIGGLGKHPTTMISTSPIFYSRKKQLGITFSDKDYIDELPITYIGNDVWIGSNSIILDGISVGNGAIIAAGSIVTKDVPPFAIVGGVPARIIKYRYTQDDINRIESTMWWDCDTDALETLSNLIRCGDIDSFVKKMDELNEVGENKSTVL
ncbi:TPA: CatB-related O-acetyltransferase [Photobacterium damselae]